MLLLVADSTSQGATLSFRQFVQCGGTEIFIKRPPRGRLLLQFGRSGCRERYGVLVAHFQGPWRASRIAGDRVCARRGRGICAERCWFRVHRGKDLAVLVGPLDRAPGGGGSRQSRNTKQILGTARFLPAPRTSPCCRWEGKLKVGAYIGDPIAASTIRLRKFVGSCDQRRNSKLIGGLGTDRSAGAMAIMVLM
jgi:hypothetical protein